MSKQKEPELLRVQMIKTIRKGLEKNSFVNYAAGEFYLLDKALANTLIKEGVAVDPTVKKEAK